MASTSMQRRRDPITEVLDWFDFAPPFSRRGVGLIPYVRIEDYIEDGTYVIRAELPGIDPDQDVELSLQGDTLTIRGERREEEKARNRHEFHYGAFERTLMVPAGTKAEDIRASYADGVLELRVPLRETEVEPRRIPVQRAGA
jgi:HSP20 family molecular chaperone IbpA